MKHAVFAAAVLCILAAPGRAETGKWTFKGIAGASFNSTGVSDNWTGTEKNAQSWGLKLDASAEKDDALTNWTTTLKEEYGRTKVEGIDEQTSADLIDLSSVYTRKLSIYVNPYLSFIMDTQNWKPFQPVTFTEAVGNGVWILNRPAQVLKTRAGVAFRQQFDPVHDVLDPSTGLTHSFSAADNPSTAAVEEAKYSLGGEWTTNYEVALQVNTKLASEARVFSAFDGGASLRWDSSLFVKLSQVLTLQLSYLFVYNFDKSPKPVWPQGAEKRLTLTLGMSYNLF